MLGQLPRRFKNVFNEMESSFGEGREARTWVAALPSSSPWEWNRVGRRKAKTNPNEKERFSGSEPVGSNDKTCRPCALPEDQPAHPLFWPVASVIEPIKHQRAQTRA